MISLRRRLLQSFLLGAVSIAALTGALIYCHVRSELDELYNAHLQQLATLMVRELDRVDSAQIAATAAATPQRLQWQEENYLIQIWDRDGRLRDEQAPAALDVTIPLFTATGLYKKRIANESWRIYRADGARVIVQIAQPENARRSIIAETSLMLWLPVSLQVPLFTLLAWFSVRRGLRPLDRLSAAIAQRRPEALMPLDISGQPTELRLLVETLNSLLSRLAKTLAQQRNFVADAAHELRTPVAALQLQLDLLQRAAQPRERDRSVAELRAGLQRATHLIEQLLSIARAEANTDLSSQNRIELPSCVEAVIERQLPFARARQIDLGVTRLEPIAIRGALGDIETVLDNLVNNAIRYTPAGGRVDLAVYREDANAVIEVTDSGPGIPASEHARIFDRFYRALHNAADGDVVAGSGLGLAIVKAICDRHAATIAVGAGEGGIGAKFTVRWPAESGV